MLYHKVPQFLQAHIYFNGERPVEGTMGADNELSWRFDKSSNTLSVSGPINERQPVYAACYNEDGRMLSVTMISIADSEITLGGDWTEIRLFWLDSTFAPKCASVVFNV